MTTLTARDLSFSDAIGHFETFGRNIAGALQLGPGQGNLPVGAPWRENRCG